MAKNNFSMVGYTGASVNSMWWDNLIIDIAGISHKERLPALLQHDHSAPAGVLEEIIKDHAVNANGYFVGEHGEKVRSLIEAGFPYQASVGIEAQEIEVLGDKETATVNGRTFSGPGAIWRKTVLKEISFVSLGRDADTSVSIAAAAHTAGTTAQSQPVTSKALFADMKAQALSLQKEEGLTMREAYLKLHKENPVLHKKANELMRKEIHQKEQDRRSSIKKIHSVVLERSKKEKCSYLDAQKIIRLEQPNLYEQAYGI